MLNEDLFNKVLIEPTKATADKIYIVSAFATPAMAYKHFSEIPQGVEIQLVIGMTKKYGIPKVYHQEFVKLAKIDFPNRFNCSYIIQDPPVHAKTYSWFCSGNPMVAFAGSANYTQSAFLGKQREVLVETEASHLKEYFESLLADAESCQSEDVNEKIKLIEIANWPYLKDDMFADPGTDSINLSLLDSEGNIHNRAGLNWGQRPGRESNQAYIPVPAPIANMEFFPLSGIYFTIITDDGVTFDAVVAQSGDKAIETPHDNSILGRYFRQRIGVPLGSFVQREDLERYGRTDVEFKKINDEAYLLDFSV